MSLFCKHEWEKISEATLPSGFQQLAGTELESRITKMGPALLVTKFVLIVTCKKCGGLRRFESENP